MQTTGQLSFVELIVNASFLVQLVMLFLLLLSVASWTIIIQRSNQYKIARKKADEFEDRFWSGTDLNNLYQDCVKRQDNLIGLEVIYSAGFKEFVRLINSGPADQEVVMDGTYRQMKVASSRELESLENHLPTLATIGSISPYIGLFGTVWGIMHAFVALAAVKNATLSMVAPPIAEALIATAMGLFAAIPAVMFYNRFATKVEALENRYLNFMDEFSTILNRRLVTIRAQMAKKETSAFTKAQSANFAQDLQTQASKNVDSQTSFYEHKTPSAYREMNQDPVSPYRVGKMPKESIKTQDFTDNNRNYQYSNAQGSVNRENDQYVVRKDQYQNTMPNQGVYTKPNTYQNVNEMPNNFGFNQNIYTNNVSVNNDRNANVNKSVPNAFLNRNNVNDGMNKNNVSQDGPHYITPGANARNR